VLIACAFLALPYAHFSYSRAEVNHLAQGVFPLLLGCLSLFSVQPNKYKWPLVILLCMATLGATYEVIPAWQCRYDASCLEVDIAGDNLEIDRTTAKEVALLRDLVGRYAPDGQSFIAAPYWPGAYALMHRKSPMWEIYALYPRSPAFELKEIARIETMSPRFAVVMELPYEGHDDLRFRNTHPLLLRYIREHFDRLPEPANGAYEIYTARESER